MIIVTGSHGFIGQRLVTALKKRGDEVWEADLKNGRNIFTCEAWCDAERVYHLAAKTDARSTEVWGIANTNIMGTLEILQRYGDKVVFASSAAVNYPFNHYAISKLACEHYCEIYGASVVRLPNVFGEGGHSFIDKCERDSAITIYGTGKQRRTWCHVDDAVVAFLTMHNKATLKIVDGQDWSVNEIAKRYNKPISYLPAREGDPFDGRQIRYS